MNIISKFRNRLLAIGVEVELAGNYAWVYLDKINGKKVKGKFMANHGFTAFFQGVKLGSSPRFSDRRVVFAKIREILEENDDAKTES